jgi:putative ABC transport system permease protein
MLQDLRHGLRLLTAKPAFAVLLVLTFAIGVGAATTIFSVAYPILLQPLPYEAPQELMAVADNVQGRPLDVTFGTYLEIAARSRSFDSLSVYRIWQPALATNEKTQRIDGQRVSADYFRVLRVAPALGRVFDAKSDRPNGPAEAVISHALWKNLFASDPQVIGRQLKLDGTPYTIVGVMPASFDNVLLPSAGIWAPLQYDPTLAGGFDTREWGHHLHMIGRLRAQVSLDAARQELASIAAHPLPDFARPRWAAMQGGMIVVRMRDHLTREAKPGIVAISIAVALLLLISCVNVVNLLLARAAQRDTEFAVRAALGATKSNVLRHVFAETFALAAVGCLLANLLTGAAVQASSQLIPQDLPRVAAIDLSLPVLVFSLILTLFVTGVAAVAPTFYSLRGGLSASLRSGSATIAQGQHRFRRALIVLQFALAVMLLVPSGLLIHSVERLFVIAPGFDAQGVLTMEVQDAAPRRGPDAMEARARAFEEALQVVRSQPGVTAAAFTSQLPLSGQADQYGVGFDDDAPDAAQGAYRYAVTPGYVEAMHIPILRGRTLRSTDNATSPHVALISASLAARRFPGIDPVGHRLVKAPLEFTIVGVVGDVKQESLAAAGADAFYVPITQWSFYDAATALVIRTANDPASLSKSVPQALWSANHDLAVTKVATLNTLVKASESRRLFVSRIFSAFAIVALILAGIGIYGVLSGGVTERMREFGVRLAFGAPPSSILSLVMRQGGRLVLIGVVAGFGAALAASRVVASLLYGTSIFDPTTYALATVAVAAVSFVACAVPARRAAAIDPAVILRAE